MNGQIFTQIALMVISVIGALVSAYVIPYIKSKTNKSDWDKLIEFVKIAVRCANQIYTPEQWEDKKKYVVNQVQAFILTSLKIELTVEQINTIIEGVVNEIKKMDGNNI